MLRARFKGRAFQCIQGVPANTPLKTGARLLAKDAQGLDLVQQVLPVLVKAGEAVDVLAIQSLPHEQVSVVRILDHVVGPGQRIERRAEDGMLDGFIHLLAEEVQLVLEPAQALNEFCACLHRDTLLWKGTLVGCERAGAPLENGRPRPDDIVLRNGPLVKEAHSLKQSSYGLSALRSTLAET
jgi:hypothetical protein